MLKRLLLSTALVLGVASSAAADYTAGLAAYANDDFATAYSEFNVSARAGNRDAQYMLGRLYELGRGVRQDFVQAHLWYNLAAAQGQSRAIAARDAIAARMTATQLAQAQQLAAAAQPGVVPTTPSMPAAATYSVRDVQRLLNQLGYNAGPVDGAMGTRTREAIRAFQRQHGMAVSEEAGRDSFG